MIKSSRGYGKVIRTRRSLIGGSLLGVLVLLVGVGCSSASVPTTSPSANAGGDSSWEQTVAQAKKEGSVTYYLAIAGGEDAIKSGFEKAYPGINLTILRQGSAQLTSKLDAEFAAQAEGGDVVMVGDKGFFDDNVDNFVPLTGPSAKLYEGTKYTNSGNRFLVNSIVPVGFGVNKDVIKRVGAHDIKTFEDVLQPQLKGLIGISDPRISAVILQRVKYEASKTSSDYMSRLAELSPRIYTATGAQVNAIAAGDLAVGMAVYGSILEPVIKAGAPVVPVYPLPESYIYFTGISKTAAHPAAAQVFDAWLLSKEGQEAQHSWGYTGSVLPNIKGAFKIDPKNVMFDGLLTDDDKAYQKTWSELFLK